MTTRTVVVLWRITERCNLACAFCAYDRGVSRTRRVASASSVLALGETLCRFQRESAARVLVSWLGGEPLLWAPLAAVSRVYRQRHDLALSLTTNGTRLHDRDTRALLVEHYSEVTISVDDIGERHDRLRGRPGLYASLARSVTQLAKDKQAAGRGPLLRANVVLMRDNIGTFASLCRDLAGWGVEEITFNQLGGADRPAFFPAHRLLPEPVRQFTTNLPVLRRELARSGVTLRGADAYLQRIAASSRGETLAPADCAPGRDFLFIDEAGRVAPCAHTPGDYGVSLENLAGPSAIAGLPALFGAARHLRRASACADCHSTQHHGKFVAVSA